MKTVCFTCIVSMVSVFLSACRSEKPEPEFSLARIEVVHEPLVCIDVSSRTVQAPKSLAGKKLVIREGSRPEVSRNEHPQLCGRTRGVWSAWSPRDPRWSADEALVLDFSSGDEVKETHRMNDGQDWTRVITYGRWHQGRKGVVFEDIPKAAEIPGSPWYFGTEWSLYFTSPDRGYAVRENFHEWGGERDRGYVFRVEGSTRKDS